MKNIVFVFNPGCFPVPAINGGAIESLITTLIDENEKEKKFMFHVIMCKNISDKYEYDYSKYQFTKFYNFYQSSLKFKIGRIVNAVNKRLNYTLPLYSSFENYLLSTIDEINPDFIVFEGTFNSTVRKLRKKYDKDKLVLHVHHKICPKYKIDNFFGRMWCVSDYIKRDWQESKVLKEDFKYQIFNNVLTSKTFNNELSDEERNQLMKQYNLKKDDFVLVYCGRLIKEKGIDILIKAVKDLNIENLKLLVIGESAFRNSNTTPFVQELRNIVDGDKRFVFTGFIDNKDLYKYYSLANVQVIPSVFEEAAGIVALEGRAVGLPQLITNAGGLPEYASKDAIVLNNDENLQQNLKEEILKFYNGTYSCEIMKEKDVHGQTEYYKQFVEIVSEN